MCLSIAYKDKVSDDTILMKNVASFSVNNNEITLVDLMERTFKIKGYIEKVDLIDNFVLIKEMKVNSNE